MYGFVPNNPVSFVHPDGLQEAAVLGDFFTKVAAGASTAAASTAAGAAATGGILAVGGTVLGAVLFTGYVASGSTSVCSAVNDACYQNGKRDGGRPGVQPVDSRTFQKQVQNTAEDAKNGFGQKGKAEQLEANKKQGKDFEQKVVEDKKPTDKDVAEQITIETESGTRTVIDVASKDSATGKVKLTEAKSGKARLSPNQKKAHPEIEKSGGTVKGKGKPGFPGGTKIPPTKVEVVRPEAK